MCYVDAETPAVFRQATPVARRGYWCAECDGIIHAGERHERICGLWDGAWATYRTCLPCVSLRAAVEAHERAEDCHGAEAIPPLMELWASAVEAEVVCRVPRESEDEDDE
jgi:hypothetical protein